MTELVEKMLAGDRLSLARLITMVERESDDVPEIMRAIYPHTGRAFCVGITGPPGGGKSTMVSRLTAIARKKGLQVGVIAVDPTSPFSGGAVLGDRVRMQQHFLDDGVFIRSMATRGSHGGLPRTASSVIKLLDASGKDIILVETVGVGQTEVDVMETADTVVVILVPEAGDTIQTMKAGSDGDRRYLRRQQGGPAGGGLRGGRPDVHAPPEPKAVVVAGAGSRPPRPPTTLGSLNSTSR